MLTLPPSVRVFVAVGATDMRLGMDGLAALARSRLGLETHFRGTSSSSETGEAIA